MNLFDKVEYVGSDPLKKGYGVGMVVDLNPDPFRPDEVTVQWATMTPTQERIEDLRVSGYQETTGRYYETTGQFIARHQGTGFMPPTNDIWLVGH